MPLTIQQSAFFLSDVEIQFRWYFDKVDLEVARHYRMAVQATILKIHQRPALGRPRFRNDPALKEIRCCLVVKPFATNLF